MACINACKYHEHFEKSVTDAFFSKRVLFVFLHEMETEMQCKRELFLFATVADKEP